MKKSDIALTVLHRLAADIEAGHVEVDAVMVDEGSVALKFGYVEPEGDADADGGGRVPRCPACGASMLVTSDGALCERCL